MEPSTQTHHWNEPVIGLTEVKRQHYVPRMFLRAFADAREQILVTDLDTCVSFRTGVVNAALESGFNNLLVQGVEVSIESWLGEVEGEADPVLKKLVAHPSAIDTVTSYEAMMLARFLASFRFRVPSFRDEVTRMRAHVLDETKRIAKSWLDNNHDAETAARIWAEWEQHPDEWFLHEDEPFQPGGDGCVDPCRGARLRKPAVCGAVASRTRPGGDAAVHLG